MNGALLSGFNVDNHSKNKADSFLLENWMCWTLSQTTYKYSGTRVAVANLGGGRFHGFHGTPLWLDLVLRSNDDRLNGIPLPS